MTHRFALFAAALAATTALPAAAESIVGLTTTNALVRFDSAASMVSGMPTQISGLLGSNERMIGIDLRPSTGLLYGLSDHGRLYTLNAMTGTATFIAGLSADPADATNPFAGLKGSSFGIDFNPVPDLGMALPSLRVTSNAGENLRINVNGASAGQVTTDADLNGVATRVVAAAYINNDRDPATGTSLFGIDATSDMLVQQVPPNNGTTVAIGALGVDASGVAGFDVSGASGIGYAALTDGDTGKSTIYSIDLTSGFATPIGAFGIDGSSAIAPPLADLTVAAVPEPETYALMLAGLGLLGVVARRRRR